MGNAMLDYLQSGSAKHIIVTSDLTEEDIINVAYLFRHWDQMPLWEKIALEKSRGTILDIGAGSGTHSKILQLMGKEVFPIDISPGSVEVMKAQHIQNVRQADIFLLDHEQYDTLLLLMNGIGLVETLEGFLQFLEHAKKLLKPGGQILFDSSDLVYLYPSEEEIARMEKERYYGEVVYRMRYKNAVSDPFGWLYIDQETLNDIIQPMDFQVEILMEGQHYEYLAKLSKA